MITIKQKGDFKKTEAFLKTPFSKKFRFILNKYGRIGVQQLQANTPKKTGLTASSWKYELIESDGKSAIIWSNTNKVKGVSIALILQYGHATRRGGYVQGIDYINPALRPIFDKMADEAWREVMKA